MKTALIVGAGTGISAHFARKLKERGWQIALAARNAERLEVAAREIDAIAIPTDSADRASVEACFARLDQSGISLDAVLYNAAQRVRGPISDLDPDEVEAAIRVTAFGGFLVAQQAARRMLTQGSGTILLTGASASLKGFSESATFAMGKFALRGLAQSMARELHPKGIHVVHFIIDGGVRNAARGRVEPEARADTLLDPAAIADAYIQAIEQPRSAWSHEIELRPWKERF